MRRVVVTKTQIWEGEMPDVGVEVEEFVDQLLVDDPDYEDVGVEER